LSDGTKCVACTNYFCASHLDAQSTVREEPARLWFRSLLQECDVCNKGEFNAYGEMNTPQAKFCPAHWPRKCTKWVRVPREHPDLTSGPCDLWCCDKCANHDCLDAWLFEFYL